jgi:hypothetical protein
MRRTVVVTVLGSLAACSGKNKEEPVTTMNPPPVEPAPAPAPPAEPPLETLVIHDFSKGKVLNADDPTHGRIYRRAEPVCYVHLPFPPQEGPPLSFRPPPTEDIACPPSMTDPSWSECAFGTVTATEDGAACSCAVMGNPPPPPRLLSTCPKT